MEQAQRAHNREFIKLTKGISSTNVFDVIFAEQVPTSARVRFMQVVEYFAGSKFVTTNHGVGGSLVSPTIGEFVAICIRNEGGAALFQDVGQRRRLPHAYCSIMAEQVCSPHKFSTRNRKRRPVTAFLAAAETMSRDWVFCSFFGCVCYIFFLEFLHAGFAL